MTKRLLAPVVCAGLIAGMTGETPQAQGPERSFQRIATFANYHNNTDLSDETVSEIIAATADGRLLVYTDSPGEQIGFIDIKDAAHPAPAGTVPLGGQPTSVDVIGNKYTVVGVNTSDEDYDNPSGNLVVVDLNTAATVATIPLDGQPDSVKVSPDQQYIAVVIENERDEGESDGELPQLTCRTLSNAYFVDPLGDGTDEDHNDDAIPSTLGSGFEGVAAVNGELYVAQQRGWHYIDETENALAAGCADLDDVEPGDGLDFGDQPPRTRIWIYDPDADDPGDPDDGWEHALWELEDVPDNADWVGLSEITYVPGNSFVLIERDNLTGDFAELKTLARVPDNALEPGATVTPLVMTVFDLLPALTATNGWITDKPEGVAITSTGTTFLVTDNDGVEDWSGDTWFLDLGDVTTLFD